jgi:hypothetical protein
MIFRVRFKPGNSVGYFQDFGWYRGMPTDVWFTATREPREKWWTLTAPNFGEEPYGNGSIFVSLRGASGRSQEPGA